VALAAGRLPLNQRPLEPAEQMGEIKPPTTDNQANRVEPLDSTNLIRLLGNGLSAETRATLDNSPGPFRAALILGSPDFMHR